MPYLWDIDDPDSRLTEPILPPPKPRKRLTLEEAQRMWKEKLKETAPKRKSLSFTEMMAFGGEYGMTPETVEAISPIIQQGAFELGRPLLSQIPGSGVKYEPQLSGSFLEAAMFGVPMLPEAMLSFDAILRGMGVASKLSKMAKTVIPKTSDDFAQAVSRIKAGEVISEAELEGYRKSNRVAADALEQLLKRQKAATVKPVEPKPPATGVGIEPPVTTIEAPLPKVEATPPEVSKVVDRWSNAKARNSVRASADLDDLEKQGFDVSDARQSLNEYKSTIRSDFDDAADFAEARAETWDEFVTTLDNIEPVEAPLPKAEAGMPEAGLQKGFFGESVEVRPQGKGVLQQASLEAFGKLEQMKAEAKIAALAPDDIVAIRSQRIVQLGGEQEALRLKIADVQEEIAGMTEALRDNPVAKFTKNLNRGEWKDTIPDKITAKQFESLTGKPPPPDMLIRGKGKVRWDDAWDKIARDEGYTDVSDFRNQVEQAGRMRTKIQELKSSIPGYKDDIARLEDDIARLSDETKELTATDIAGYERLPEAASADLDSQINTVYKFMKASEDLETARRDPLSPQGIKLSKAIAEGKELPEEWEQGITGGAQLFSKEIDNAVATFSDMKAVESVDNLVKGGIARTPEEWTRWEKFTNFGLKLINTRRVIKNKSVDSIWYTSRTELNGSRDWNARKTVLIGALLRRGFGGTVVKKAGTEFPFRDLYIGKQFPGSQKRVGSLVDVVENPHLYRGLNDEQQEVINTWTRFFNTDRDYTARVGGSIGEIEGNYVPRLFKNPEKVLEFIGKQRGTSTAFKKRTLTREDWLGLAEQHGWEVENDIMQLAQIRLDQTARMRAMITFRNGVVETYKGRLLSAGKKLRLGEGEVQFGRDRYAFPASVANDINRELINWDKPLDEAAILRLVNLTKAMVLNFDLNFVGRQWAASFAQNPRGSVAAMQEAFQSFKHMFNQEALAMDVVRNAERYMFAAKNGLALNETPYAARLSMVGGNQGLLEKVGLVNIPVLRQAQIGVTQTAKLIEGVADWLTKAQFSWLGNPLKLRNFEDSLDLLKTLRDSKSIITKAGKSTQEAFYQAPLIGSHLRKAGNNLYTMSDLELARIAADYANDVTGGIFRPKYFVGSTGFGVTESLIVFTQGWTRARGRMFYKALTSTGPEGMLARRMVASQMLVYGGLASLASYALNKELPDLDPRSVRFGAIKMPWGYVRIIPDAVWIRSVARLIGGTPGATKYGENFFEQRLNTLTRFGESREGLTLQIARGVMSGKTYRGENITNKPVWALTQMTPLTARSIIEDKVASQDEGYIPRAILEAVGVTSWAQSPSEKLQKYAEQVYGKKWDDLEPYQKAAIKVSPEGRQLIEQYQQNEYVVRMGVVIDEYEKQENRDRQLAGSIMGTLKDGERPWTVDEWREESEQAAVRRAASLEQYDADFKRVYQDDPNASEQDKALSAYYDLIETMIDPLDRFDFDKWDKARPEFMASLPPEIAKYVERNVGIYATPLQEEFKKAKAKLDDYWNIKDEIAATNKKGAYYYDKVNNRLTPQHIKDKLRLDPAYKQFKADYEEATKSYRYYHPEVNALYKFWYTDVNLLTLKAKAIFENYKNNIGAMVGEKTS